MNADGCTILASKKIHPLGASYHLFFPFRRAEIGGLKLSWLDLAFLGHPVLGPLDPQTCVYPDVCLGIADVSGKAPLSGHGKRADTLCICPFPLSRERGFTRYIRNP